MPIDNSIGYRTFYDKEATNYDNKVFVFYVMYWKNKIYEKFTVHFDYDTAYYLNKYEVVDREEVSKEYFQDKTGIKLNT